MDERMDGWMGESDRKIPDARNKICDRLIEKRSRIDKELGNFR